MIENSKPNPPPYLSRPQQNYPQNNVSRPSQNYPQNNVSRPAQNNASHPQQNNRVNSNIPGPRPTQMNPKNRSGIPDMYI